MFEVNDDDDKEIVGVFLYFNNPFNKRLKTVPKNMPSLQNHASSLIL